MIDSASCFQILNTKAHSQG